MPQCTQILLYSSFLNHFFFVLFLSLSFSHPLFRCALLSLETDFVFLCAWDHHRNSHVIIPSIIKFLFYLSKQKDKKLITVPKIINITDTLLANGGNVRGSTEALLELAHEFFFQETMQGVGEGGDAAAAAGDADIDAKTMGDAESKLKRMEANTQKEVAFSMLLKFLEYPQVRHEILPWCWHFFSLIPFSQ